MKKFLLLLGFLFTLTFLGAQNTNAGTFKFRGKTYTANYDAGKHSLVFSKEMSFEIYDETGSCVKRGTGLKVDFKPLLKPGGEQSFTVLLYKKTKRKAGKIVQKGNIGTMVVIDSKD